MRGVGLGGESGSSGHTTPVAEGFLRSVSLPRVQTIVMGARRPLPRGNAPLGGGRISLAAALVVSLVLAALRPTSAAARANLGKGPGHSCHVIGWLSTRERRVHNARRRSVVDDVAGSIYQSLASGICATTRI